MGASNFQSIRLERRRTTRLMRCNNVNSDSKEKHKIVIVTSVGALEEKDNTMVMNDMCVVVRSVRKFKREAIYCHAHQLNCR